LNIKIRPNILKKGPNDKEYEIDILLLEIGYDIPTLQKRNTVLPNSSTKLKCTTSSNCNNLKCIGCDFKLIKFENQQWKQIDYLYLRTHYPNLDKLSEKLVSCQSKVSLCCQCLAETIENGEIMLNSKWRCGGHV
jgi:cytochrome c